MPGEIKDTDDIANNTNVDKVVIARGSKEKVGIWLMLVINGISTAHLKFWTVYVDPILDCWIWFLAVI